MIYLIFSVLSSVLIFIVFKKFDSYQINNFQAIIVNYIVAFTIGIFTFPGSINFVDMTSRVWFIPAVFIGTMFISLFTVMAIVAQKMGVSVVSVAVKMAVVIPVMAGFILYNEEVTALKVIGILFALASVLLVTIKKEKIPLKALLLLPLILFFGNGSLDAILKYCQEYWVTPEEIPLFTAFLFGSAGAWGMVSFPVVNKKKKIELKNVWGGILLGIPNFGSIYFLLLALDQSSLESSALFPINNVAIVLTSTFIAYWAFKEKLTLTNWIGVIIGILSIVLISI